MASSSEVKVSLCSDEDIPAAFQAVSRGFGHDAPFFDAYFPCHDTEAGQRQGTKRLLQIKRSEEESYFVKAVLESSDGQPERIIGLALWTHMKEAPSDKLDEVEDVEGTWPDKEDREYMRRLWKDYVIPRSEAVRASDGAGVYGRSTTLILSGRNNDSSINLVLELLAVDREYQRRGAGAALVSWGVRAADKKGLEAIVEGTPQGVKCYHKGGFRTEIEEMKLEVGERFSDRKKPILSFLRREAKK